MSKARTLGDLVSTGSVLADGTIDAAEIGNLTLPSGGDIVGTTATQTLTNKTIDYTANTITNLPETNPAGSTGQVQYNNAGAFGALADGTSGQVLTSAGSGSAPTWADPAGGGSLVFISSVTASNSATVAFTGINSTYDVYVVELVTVIPAVGAINDLRIRLSSDNGSTYFSGGLDYGFSYLMNASNNVTAGGDGSNGNNHIFIAEVSNAALGAGVNGFINIFNPARAAYTLLSYDLTSSTSETTCKQYRGNGVTRQSTAKNAIQFYFGDGNISSGTFRLYGIKNS